MRSAFRLLPLPLCVALSLAAPEAAAASGREEDYSLCPVDDAVPMFPDAQVTSGAPQDRSALPTDISGDSVDGVNGQTTNISGKVTLKRGDQFLGTDNLVYDQQTEKYVAKGNVRYQDGGMRMLADRATGDQERDEHTIDNVRYQLTQARGNGRADNIEMVGEKGRLLESTYSTCPPNDRRWDIKAKRIDVDTVSGFGTARSATVRVRGIPVFYFPWFRFPIDERRQTGLLFPLIGSSNRNGFDYRQPIYLNLAPNYDATITPRLMTNRGLMLEGEFRFLNPTSRGVVEAGYLPSDNLVSRRRVDEDTEFLINRFPQENKRANNRARFSFFGSQDLGPAWQARANLNWISDPRYFEDIGNRLGVNASYLVPSDIGLYGRGRFWEASLSADTVQLADYTLPEAILPYSRLPRATFRYSEPMLPWLTTNVETEAVRFQHINSFTRPGGSRFDFKPSISMPFGGASWFVTPTLAYRYTTYQLDSELAQQIAARNGATSIDKSPSRALPIGTVDAGLFFDRSTTIKGDSYLQTIEPRLFYVRTPYRNQNDLPLFDTQQLTFSYGQLFRDNRFSGADRQADANQLTLAVSSRLIRETDGKEKFTASFGQIRYFEDSRVGLNPGDLPIQKGKSSWIAESTYAPNDDWNISAAYQWDPKRSQEELASMRVRYLVGDKGIVNFSYRYRRDLLEQADLSFLYPITPSWSVVGRYYYSIKDNTLLEGLAGVQWDSCCLAVRVVGRRFVRRNLIANNQIQFEIELKGLSSVGADAESRLRRAILGYDRDDLYLVPPAEVRSGSQVIATDPLR